MKMARCTFAFTVMLLVVNSLACKSNKTGESNNQTGNGNANAQAAVPTGGVAGGKVATGRTFRGWVGGNSVQMTLNREGDQLKGTYYYQRVKTDLSVKGSINGQGDFTLQEFDAGGKQTGEFKGKWIESADRPTSWLDGNWSKPNSTDTLSFYATEQIVEFNNGLSIVTKEINEENKKARYSIKIEYPEIAGGSDANVSKFNEEVKNIVTKEASAFKGGDAQDASDGASDTGSGSDLQIGYDVTLATNDIISVLLSASSYSAGAAHPNSYTLAVTFDLKAGRRLKLSDLFTSGSDYLNAISRFAVSDLKKQAGADADSDWIGKGAGPDAENFANWNISKKGLAITFDPYQVASYAEGTKYVLVPYSSLKEVARSDGPISYVSK